MIRIDAVVDLAGAFQFLCWSFVIYGVTHATFRSFLMEEFLSRWAASRRPRMRDIQRLNWEIRNREKWQAPRAQGDEMTAPIRLREDELKTKEAELIALTKSSLGVRIFQYFISCPFCQLFWVALILLFVWQGLDNIWLTISSAFAYLFPCMIITRLLDSPQNRAQRGQTSSCPGGNCGGRV